MEDVERLFGESVITWMENKGYKIEAEYLRVVRNWRRASDERGLNDEQRYKFNKEFLNYIFDDLMLWHRDKGLQDFRMLEVNRYVALKNFSCRWYS